MPNDPPATNRAHEETSTSKIVRNSAFNVLGMVLIVPLNFVALFTLARRMGKESLGIFFTLFAISAVIYLVTSSGVTTVLMRRVAQSRERTREIVGEAAGLLTVISGLSVVAFLVTAFVWSQRTGRVLGWKILLAAAIAMVARHTLEFCVAVCRGVERFEFENAARVLQAGLYCVLVLGLVHPGGEFRAFASFALSNVLAAVLLATVLFLKFNCRSYSLSWSALRHWYAESLPLGAGDVIRRVGWQLETLMLAALRSPATVGLYSIAYRPLQPLQILPRSLVSVTFPLMSRRAVDDPGSLRSLVGSSTALLWLLSLPLAISVTVCARPLILATAGPDYASATRPLQLLIWLTGLTFVNTQLRFVFSAINWERKYCLITVAVLAAKFFGGLIWIPLWGIYGACFSNLLGEGLLTVWGLTKLRNSQLIEIAWPKIFSASAAGLVMGALLYPVARVEISLQLALAACIMASFVFLGLCLVFGALERQQVAEVIEILSSRVRRRAETVSVVQSSE